MAKFLDDWGPVVGIIIFVVVFSLLVYALVDDTTPVTGQVVRLWTQGNYDYATLQHSDGTLSAYYLYATDYGVLSVGQTCTFQVNGTVAKSVSCTKAGQ